MTLRRADMLLITVVLLCTVGLFLLFRPGGAAAVATIEQDGVVVVTLPLDSDAVYELGGNTVTIAGGLVRMSYADCADGLCTRGAAVSREGESIVCLPNRVVVTVSGVYGGYDMVVG